MSSCQKAKGRRSSDEAPYSESIEAWKVVTVEADVRISWALETEA